MKIKLTGKTMVEFITQKLEKRISLVCFIMVGLFPMMTAVEGLSAQEKQLTIVNYSNRPVYSTAVTIPLDQLYKAAGLPVGVPLQLSNDSGDLVPVLSGKENGKEVLRAYLSLKANEKVILNINKAAQWNGLDKICSAKFNAASGSASIHNGIVALNYIAGQWSFAFDGPMANTLAKPSERQILNGCWADIWLDAERRGRLLGIDTAKIREMGLINSKEAQLKGGESKVNPDGSVTLRITKGFEGFAKDVAWTEIYTLLPGQPVLTYHAVFESKGDASRYLAFVELGGGMRGDFGNLLCGKMRFKYEDPRSPNRILLSGNENSFTRIGWRGEKCWVGVESELGCGAGFSTLDEVTRSIPGSSVWSLSNSGFFVRFMDARQENFPYEFAPGSPIDLGLAFVATSGEASIWNQTRQLFAAVTKGNTPLISSSCAVYLGDIPLQAGEAGSFVDDFGAGSKMTGTGTTRQAALNIDFNRYYQLTAKAEQATANAPVTIQVKPLGKTANPFTVLVLDQAVEKKVDFTRLTGWEGLRQTFTLEVKQPEGSRLSMLKLDPVGFPSPELGTPSDGMRLTDLATFFRWKQVKGALDYELQLAQNSQFSNPATLAVRSEVEWPYYLPSDNELPKPGTWFWRVRAVEQGRPGTWSESRRMEINNDHVKKPVTFVISPEHPLFTIEACRVTDLSRFTNTIPADIKPFVAFNCNSKFNLIEYLKPLYDSGQTAFVRTHGPGPMSYWTPLADLEAVFQAYPNVIGIMGGETLSTHYHGGPMQTYINRLLKLCGKYGRIFYDADGTYPGENKWEALYTKEGRLMKEYAGHLIFAQKNNILHRQFVSQSSVLGLYLTDGILAQGAWEDGGWYWQQVGFRKLGDIRGQRGGEATDMPRNFWNLTFLMGISRGCSVFSFEGQTGTMPVAEGWKLSEKGLPPNANPMAHWTNKGELTPAFNRFMAPFIRGVIKHRMVPTREQVLKNIKLAVYNDGVPKKEDGDQYYYEWEALYRGTYGFRDVGKLPGTLMEFFPNTGRYNYFPVFPQGKVELKGVETLPLSQLMDSAKVKTRFDKAYPEWYQGEALVTLVGDMLTVMNSHENQDVTETYTVPLRGCGIFQMIAGKIAPHTYLMGKFEDNNQKLWLQANTEYPGRDTELTIICKVQPKVKVTPDAAAMVNKWDAATGTLTLRLSHADGAVEVEITGDR
jgi:hypothetical protein